MVFRVLAVTLLLAQTAVAGPAAEQLFQDGRRLLGEGKLPEACDAFRRSQDLEPKIGTLLNLGDCEQKRGRIATAWAAFAEARAMAKRMGDPRADEAEKRAGALTTKLPYLTIRIAPAARAQGVVVSRSGTAVPAAELDHEVPVDPGRYEITATAPRMKSWSTTIDVAQAQHLGVDVPELAADPDARKEVTPPAAGIVVAPPPVPMKPLPRHFGVGVAFGLSSDRNTGSLNSSAVPSSGGVDILVGIRVPVHLGDLGSGSLRFLPNVRYTHIQDPFDNSHNFELVAIGAGIEYAQPLAPKFMLAMGLGVGVDVIDDSYNYELSTQGWGAARLSPTFRLAKVDIGLHMQAVATKSAVVGVVELGVDYFFW
ncbi:MAG: hypothetical protein H0T46_33745 [Deltaproteobacteria bacterium]|nr:hypothetical protein [Deltaproteobacteria bacterium]